MDNNIAERAQRGVAVGRKVFYGAGSLVSGHMVERRPHPPAPADSDKADAFGERLRTIDPSPWLPLEDGSGRGNSFSPGLFPTPPPSPTPVKVLPSPLSLSGRDPPIRGLSVLPWDAYAFGGPRLSGFPPGPPAAGSQWVQRIFTNDRGPSPE